MAVGPCGQIFRRGVAELVDVGAGNIGRCFHLREHRVGVGSFDRHNRIVHFPRKMGLDWASQRYPKPEKRSLPMEEMAFIT